VMRILHLSVLRWYVELFAIIDPEATGPAQSSEVVDPEATAPAQSSEVVDPEATGPAQSSEVIDPEATGPAEVVDPEATGPAQSSEVVDPETTGPAQSSEDAPSADSGEDVNAAADSGEDGNVLADSGEYDNTSVSAASTVLATLYKGATSPAQCTAKKSRRPRRRLKSTENLSTEIVSQTDFKDASYFVHEGMIFSDAPLYILRQVLSGLLVPGGESDSNGWEKLGDITFITAIIGMFDIYHDIFSFAKDLPKLEVIVLMVVAPVSEFVTTVLHNLVRQTSCEWVFDTQIDFKYRDKGHSNCRPRTIACFRKKSTAVSFSSSSAAGSSEAASSSSSAAGSSAAVHTKQHIITTIARAIQHKPNQYL
jgi:hypothetical protein